MDDHSASPEPFDAADTAFRLMRGCCLRGRTSPAQVPGGGAS